MQEGISARSAWRILHHQLLYPYHIQRVQDLQNRDFLPRLAFCQQIRQQSALDLQFLNNILFTDEVGFTRGGIFNFHNCHVWAAVNPNEVKQACHQKCFSFNVWVGILGDCLIGPHFLPHRLNGEQYLRFLRNGLPNSPLRQRQEMWFMHDDAPAHFHLSVRRYGERWIGRGGPVSWPPRSPDLNPLDFCVWGYAKGIVYNTADIATPEYLLHRIAHAFQQMKNDLVLLERICGSLRRRLDGCIQEEGQHFEHLL